ncbi:competence/damage-inducible protein A [Salipaludibacillus keqinensis]|uniref:Putative competence-damage inducible protein n=1 Tax=Salipaludibacillus keqinensis TaxID=2045207 RepID=A0A323THR4_9BACI|nr:competence/damage-inducible protein A [Salipaludibacillus keqinensis]PYZ93077.1 competence/damage-inducible protein A [Salipaludibacillus keqinensis]
MNAEIIAVGSELLLGQIQNSNATYLSEDLSSIGVNVYHHVVVGDNPHRLADVVRSGLERSDLLVFTGGLGPTKDDLTKETIAKVINKDLVYDEATEKRIQSFFAKRRQVMTDNNRKQAMVLEGAKILPNDHGLACGLVVELDGKTIVLLPGPPNEMIPMVKNYAIPYLKKQLSTAEQIQSKVLRFFDIGESQLVEKLDDLIENQTSPTIAPLASEGEITLRLTVKGQDQKENDVLLENLKSKILERLGNYYYGEDDQTLSLILQQELHDTKQTLAVAESLTGGLFSTTLTDLAGASTVFAGAVICYSNAVKESELSVSQEIFERHGAVSSVCAKTLAANIKQKLNSDIGISFTGVAGPDSHDGHEPGHVFIGIATKNRVVSYELQLAGSRDNIRQRSVKYGLYYLIQCLRKEKVDE